MRNWHTVFQTAEAIPGVTENSVRWHIFNRATNGLDDLGAIIKLGRKVLIDLDLYLKWIESEPAPYKPEASTRKKEAKTRGKPCTSNYSIKEAVIG